MAKQIKASSSKKVWKGGCLCGNITFEATGTPGKPHTCSCKMCQRHTGSLTASWVEFPKEDLAWTGPGGAPATFRSSDNSSRAFCPKCGSSIGAIDDAPVVALLIGAFDKTASKELMPTYHSYRGGRPKWWHVDANVPERVSAKDQ
ncbi:MAG: GFA family protein [Rhizobiaceae bacterium]